MEGENEGDEEEEEAEAEEDNHKVEDEPALGNDRASNKEVILRKLEEAERRLEHQLAEVEEAAILQGRQPAFSQLKMRFQQQLATYLQMAAQTTVNEYAKEGSEALLQVIVQWSRDTIGQLQAWIAEKG